MKSRKLGIALLIMLAFVVTTGTFAYWASGLAGDTSDAVNAGVTIGQGAEITSTVSIAAESVNNTLLVPTTQITVVGDDTATVTFPVTWDADSGTEFDGVTGTLTATVTNAAIGGLSAARVAVLFDIQITAGQNATITEGNATPVDLVVTVVFQAEPQDLTEYTAVANGTLTFDVTFTVTPD